MRRPTSVIECSPYPTSEEDYGFVELLGAGDSVVGCGLFGAIVSLPKMPNPIVRSRTIRQATKMPSPKIDLAPSLEPSRSSDIGPSVIGAMTISPISKPSAKCSVTRAPTEADR